MKKASKALFFLIGLLAAHLFLAFFHPAEAVEILLTTKTYLLEMLSVLPPILILVGLFEVWVPKSVITRFLGAASGWKGVAVAVLTGTAAMGPLYVAFPIGVSLLDKGASLFNVAIFLCVWASIKIPMILFEVKFLGAGFAGLRLALTLPSIVIISYFLNAVMKRRNPYEKTETS
jgi:uncharacterized membrane protein YraQ (UPF0718 family)